MQGHGGPCRLAHPPPIAPKHPRGRGTRGQRKRSPLQRVGSSRHRGGPGDGARRRGPGCRPGCSPGRNAVPGHRQPPAKRIRTAPGAPRSRSLGPPGAPLCAAGPAHSQGRPMCTERGKPGAGRGGTEANPAAHPRRGLSAPRPSAGAVQVRRRGDLKRVFQVSEESEGMQFLQIKDPGESKTFRALLILRGLYLSFFM